MSLSSFIGFIKVVCAGVCGYRSTQVPYFDDSANLSIQPCLNIQRQFKLVLLLRSCNALT